MKGDQQHRGIGNTQQSQPLQVSVVHCAQNSMHLRVAQAQAQAPRTRAAAHPHSTHRQGRMGRPHSLPGHPPRRRCTSSSSSWVDTGPSALLSVPLCRAPRAAAPASCPALPRPERQLGPLAQREAPRRELESQTPACLGREAQGSAGARATATARGPGTMDDRDRGQWTAELAELPELAESAEPAEPRPGGKHGPPARRSGRPTHSCSPAAAPSRAGLPRSWGRRRPAASGRA